ncbi:hypothetical protein [Streptomyces odontomachi]|uniref:hypothetical protein n=1 Tax=Streptomyces odontomachi TaxID=2944940 RepID=UPI00210B08AD|nr:hypothetical protein [Streptomyces sp. ODS25]
METKHQSVRDYIAARERGDDEMCERIQREVIARYETRTADNSELVDLGRAMGQWDMPDVLGIA